ncbi:MAG: hypothetical protein ACKVLL_02315 [Verrucomicrobiales bacterium]|jgi:hypothetical protein
MFHPDSGDDRGDKFVGGALEEVFMGVLVSGPVSGVQGSGSFFIRGLGDQEEVALDHSLG